MPKYVIEREMPGAGKLNSNWKDIAQTSMGASLGNQTQVQFVNSQITDDKNLLHVHSA
jgi:hypothetical protein